MDVAVVILNWNGKNYLEKFLPLLIEYSKHEAEIYIADNASEDDSISFMEANYPQIKILKNAENGGFAKGYNDALKRVSAKYYVLLNSDVEVTPNWIKPIIEIMEKDPGIAACQPKILDYNNREYFEYAGAAGGFIDKYGYPFCRGRLFNTLEKDYGQYNDPCEIFWATGAAMFVRSDLYHEFNGLDEGFFAHMEEIDFCWRLKNHGYKIYYCPDSTVFHIGGGTLPKNNARKTFYNFRNNFALLFKNLESRRLYRVFFARLILDAIAGIKFLFEGGFKNMFAVISAHFAFYGRLKHYKKKRRTLEQKPVSQIYWKNIVLQYYLLKKRHFSELDTQKFSK